MHWQDLIIVTILAVIVIAIVYGLTGWQNVKNCYAKWFQRDYWTNYNTVEALSWITKIFIIIPGLIFGLQIWWLFLFAMLTSATLIWASNKKLLPTLVGFNSIWIWLAMAGIYKNLVL